MAIVAAFVMKGPENINNKKTSALQFACLFHFVIAAARLFQGHRGEFLGLAFAGKGVMGYLKVVILLTVVGAVVICLWRYVGSFVKKYSEIYAFAILLTIVCFGLPKLEITVAEGCIATVAAGIYEIIRCKKGNDPGKSEQNTRHDQNDNKALDPKTVVIIALLWTVTLVLLAPAEIYAYNKNGFMFRFGDFFPMLLLFAVLFLLVTYLAARYLWKPSMRNAFGFITLFYATAVYIQTMLLNGEMTVMEGTEQVWTTAQTAINIAVWLIILIGFTIAWAKIGQRGKLCVITAGILTALQLLGLASILFTGNVINEKKMQLTKEGMFELGRSRNTVVFILDTYDVQMIGAVEASDPDFFSELKDFTLYDNMVSRFGYTDGTLPYLLTGILAESYGPEQYEQSDFLHDLHELAPDIKLITEGQYAEYTDDGLIANRTDDYDVKMNFGKTVDRMIDCGRYRGLPFALKNLYGYSQTDLGVLIDDTDAYVFGTDDLFYRTLKEEKVKVDDSLTDTFRLYHIYGAHSPYYLREDMTYDYGSEDPIAQWRASMDIVYSYLDHMKQSGTYDDATIIIMADHGPNVKQRAGLERLGISFTDELRPIFFIKRPGEQNDTYSVDHKDTSHDVFCATVIKSYDESDDKYGKAVWE